jgi:hypothetical protein
VGAGLARDLPVVVLVSAPVKTRPQARRDHHQEAHMSIISVGLSIAASTGPYVNFPSFNARPMVGADRARVEAVTDLGPVQELIVMCNTGTAIVSYSKIDKVFCGAGNQCNISLPIMVRKVCK